MTRNTKFFLLLNISIIITGLVFLWFGLKSPSSPSFISPSPYPGAEVTNLSKVKDNDVQAATQGVMGEKAVVGKVVDGDTIDLEDGRVVRLVGIDTPETVDPKRPVGCFGKEASNETKGLLTGKVVILQKDISETDKYKRLLRYIYLPLENGSTLFVNDYLVREGFAKVYTYPPDTKFDEQFKAAEKQAREGRRGLWGKC